MSRYIHIIHSNNAISTGVQEGESREGEPLKSHAGTRKERGELASITSVYLLKFPAASD